MPHLVYQGRYWKLSGDEFVLPSACAACLRLFWICSLVAIISATMSDLSSCDDGWVILLYLFFSILVCFLAVVCEGLLVLMSLKGSIVDADSRKGLGRYLNLHIVLGVLQFCCAVVGIVIVSRHDFPCSDQLSVNWDNVLLLAVVVSQLIDMFGLLCCFSVFRSHRARGREGEYEDADPENPPLYTIDDAQQRWEKRCKTGCKYLQLGTCNLLGGQGIGDELEAVGALFAQFFHHEGFLDVVPSDVAAGLVLVRLQQRASVLSLKKGTESGSPLVSSEGTADGDNGETSIMMKTEGVYHHIDVKAMGRHLFDKSDPKDLKLIADAAHFAPYALAAYTHLMYLFMHPACGLCQLCQYRTCPGAMKAKSNDDLESGEKNSASCGSNWFGSCCNLGSAPVIGDNSCSINKTAMLKMVNNRNGELVFANFSNDLDIKPYGVFVDKDREAVVITIRGTLSLEDCISDALADAASMKTAGEKWGFDGTKMYAHSGMLRAAMWMRQDLESSGLLSDLLSPRGGVDDPVSFAGDNVVPEIAIRRAAGADTGDAFKTSAGLRTPLNKKKYRQLVVVGHSLGAGTASVLAVLLRPAYPSLVSFAYGAPGSVFDEKSSRAIQPFVTSVILGKDLVGSLSVKNLSILRSKVLDALIRCKVNKNIVMRALFEERAHDLDALMYAPGSEPDSDFKRMVESFNGHMERRSIDMRREKLFIPGRVLHLVKTKTAKRCFHAKQKVYEPTEADIMDFTEIKISPTMVWEHFPDQYCDALDAVVERWADGSAK